MIYLTDISIKNQMIFLTYSNKHTKVIYFNQNNKKQILSMLEKLNIQYEKDKKNIYLYLISILIISFISIFLLKYTFLASNLILKLSLTLTNLTFLSFIHYHFYHFFKKQLIFKNKFLSILKKQELPNEISNILYLDAYKNIKKVKENKEYYYNSYQPILKRDDNISYYPENNNLKEDKAKILQFKRK